MSAGAGLRRERGREGAGLKGRRRVRKGQGGPGRRGRHGAWPGEVAWGDRARGQEWECCGGRQQLGESSVAGEEGRSGRVEGGLEVGGRKRCGEPLLDLRGSLRGRVGNGDFAA